MARSALIPPQTDPQAIFELFRASFATELLVASVAHFNLFTRLAKQPLSLAELEAALKMAQRPTLVLTTALQAMGLLQLDKSGRFVGTPLAAEHLVPGGDFYVGDYVSRIADRDTVLEIVERLRTNRPAGIEENQSGAAFIYREGMRSAMEQTELARYFTLALAGRAKNVAPVLATAIDLSNAKTLLDVGGGTGIYSISFLQKNPKLRAIVLDRPEVLKVTAEFANEFGVADRLECVCGDMFSGADYPQADVVLLSNVLHDWDVAECRRLVSRSAAGLPKGGRLLIHDALLNDAMDGPLAVALYSAALFVQTEGRAYSGAEYAGWLTEVGLRPGAVVPTLAHCSVVVGTK